MSARLLNVQQKEVIGQVISWVGECPWTSNVCFGTNEGALEFPPELAATASLNGGALNGVAFSGDLVALSSPSEVTVFARISEEPLSLQKLDHSFEGGAHSVVAAAPGAFLATLGDDGLLFLGVDASRKVTARVGRQASALEYYYKIVPFVNQLGGELFLCAARRDGILVINTEKGIPRPPVICYRFRAHDIVDICPLNTPEYPRAAACLSRSCGIFVVPDVLSNEQPYEVGFADIKGTGYALAAAQDHLFLLTSETFTCFPSVVSRILKQAPLNSMPTPILPIGASDMFIVGEQRVVLLVDGGVRFIEISELVGGKPAATEPSEGSENKQVFVNDPIRQPTSRKYAWQDSTLDLAFSDAVPV